MNIEEFADIANVQMIIRRYPLQHNRYSCSFEHAETKDHESSCILCSEHGNGDTPQKAIDDYCRKIRGKLLIINAYGDKRKEFGVPNNLQPCDKI